MILLVKFNTMLTIKLKKFKKEMVKEKEGKSEIRVIQKKDITIIISNSIIVKVVVESNSSNKK
jgi:hypothetical protein